MGNYKIKVSSEAESKEVQELFFELGYTWFGGCTNYSKYTNTYISIIGGLLGVGDGSCVDDDKELTIPQLRDLVVLKRNDVKDATHYRSDGKEYFQTCDKERHYHFQDEEWVLSTWMNYQLLPQLKPITKDPVVKEFLVKSQDGKWRLETEVVGDPGDDIIEVPEGAKKLTACGLELVFWTACGGYSWHTKNSTEWDNNKELGLTTFDQYFDDETVILWQRETLNDKVASAEVARQEFIGAPFSDLPEFNFEAADDFVESNVEQGAKHSHYKKDISHLDTLDIYRVTELFNPHSCGAHIAKKALCSGQRGHKDLLTDIQDIIDTAERWKEMLIEDEKAK